MKRLSLIFALPLAAGLLCAAAAARAGAPYNDTLKGFRTAAGDGDGVAVVIEAAGDLPGMGKLTLRREADKVIGGSWTLTVLPANADASSSEKGTLAGGVTGGTISQNPDGTLAALGAVQLTVESGAGQYADVSGGSGTVNLSSVAENPSQLGGTLVLNF